MWWLSPAGLPGSGYADVGTAKQALMPSTGVSCETMARSPEKGTVGRYGELLVWCYSIRLPSTLQRTMSGPKIIPTGSRSTD